jgi:hypothetical protein
MPEIRSIFLIDILSEVMTLVALFQQPNPIAIQRLKKVLSCAHATWSTAFRLRQIVSQSPMNGRPTVCQSSRE